MELQPVIAGADQCYPRTDRHVLVKAFWIYFWFLLRYKSTFVTHYLLYCKVQCKKYISFIEEFLEILQQGQSGSI